MARQVPAEIIVPHTVGFSEYNSIADLGKVHKQGTLFYSRKWRVWGHYMANPSADSWTRIDEAKVPKKHRALILLVG